MSNPQRHTVRQLMLTDDAGYVQTFFWSLPTKDAALEQACAVLNTDTTGRMAINIVPCTGLEDHHEQQH